VDHQEFEATFEIFARECNLIGEAKDAVHDHCLERIEQLPDASEIEALFNKFEDMIVEVAILKLNHFLEKESAKTVAQIISEKILKREAIVFPWGALVIVADLSLEEIDKLSNLICQVADKYLAEIGKEGGERVQFGNFDQS